MDMLVDFSLIVTINGYNTFSVGFPALLGFISTLARLLEGRRVLIYAHPHCVPYAFYNGFAFKFHLSLAVNRKF